MGQSVGIRVDSRRKQPLHRQIFDEVVARIEARAFPPGYKLPPTRVLATELAAHRNTVARAYADLEAAGFVSSRVGRGTFVERLERPQREAKDAVASAAAPRRDMPWASLLSRAARSDAVQRRESKPRIVQKPGLINLARMQPSEELIPEALLRRCISRAMAEHGSSALLYAPPEGTPRLREQIARDLVGRGVPVQTADVIVTSASQQGLDLVARALLNPGDTLLVEPATYTGAIELFGLAGARLLPVPMDAEGPDPDGLARLSGPDVKGLYLMPNANNPTGRMLSTERRRQLLEWSQKSGIPIIEDDYAAGLVLSPQDPPPHLRALDGDVIHISTFSKRLAPGLRVGYIIAPAPLRPALIALKHIVDLGTSLLLQHGLAEFIERGYLRAHEQRMAREYRERRDALDAALRKSLPAEFRWQLPGHGLVLWLRLPPGITAEAFYEEALRRGVLVGPGTHFSVGAQAEAAVRLSFCAEPSARLAEGARRLGKACKQLLNVRRAAKDAGGDSVLELV
ncbi:MAG TPA: PLP-dependent aminotransferase family protein [Polyangiales bacterium]|nr:PLP-dependent aminotransferase family protein [Polyangiales bacterium]